MISIIVPTFNRAPQLRGTLASVASQKLREGEFEVIVVDNDSTDATVNVAAGATRQWPSCKIRYVHEPVPGLLSGRHRGAKEADGDILVFIDDDIIAQEGWLESLRVAFTEATVQLAGGRSIPAFETRPPPWVSELWQPSPYGGRVNLYYSLVDFGDKPFDVDPCYIFGLNYAIRRRALYALGGFHPDCIPPALQMYQGDGETGLSLKGKAEGYVARYIPGALVHHQIPTSRMTAQYIKSRAYYAGVCDSYTYIRTHGRANPIIPPAELGGATEIGGNHRNRLRRLWDATIGRWKNGVQPQKGYPRDGSASIKDIEAIAQNAFQAGYAFHQNAVSASQILLDWVLRETYWDYNLPSLNPTAFEETSP